MNKKSPQKNQKTKDPAVQKFEKMFREVDINPEKKESPNFLGDQQSTWIVSDNNSEFKSFVENGKLERHTK